jgi:hypothetical protein
MPPASADIKNKRRKSSRALKIAARKVARPMVLAWGFIKNRANRSTFANLLMLCFIIFTSIGAGLIFLPAGWVVAGVCCGIFGFLLGSE